MRIHTDVLDAPDFNEAARIARVTFTRIDWKGSRSRNRSVDLILTGESHKMQNGGTERAATWDQWGVFLAVLFDKDPSMTTTYYADADAFARKTADRFGAFDDVRRFVAIGWPNDSHGDHQWDYAGVPGEQACTKCTAIRRPS